ncbi:MAG: cobalt-precorrin-7 (C(5))-methyltransferase [Methanomassiliicoccus sp.]|nr:cobalt-precorrin-7 (C(5))-methyltransferase [Methanomassiliicoccus sp.]
MIVVGVGCGPGMLTMNAMDRLKKAKNVYGSDRALAMVRQYLPAECRTVTLKDYSRLNELPEDSIVLSTGDPMLAGLGHLGEEVVPGISSMQCAFSRLRLPLTKAVVVDAHGKDEDVARREMVEEVERGRIPFVLTEPGFDIIALCHVMQEKGLKCKVIACENLGYADEIISFGDTTRPPMITSRLFSLILVGEGCR